MKTGIIIDSSFGITEKEAKKVGLYFIPIMVIMDGKEYKSGIDIDIDWLVKNLKKDSDFKTAACNPSEIINVYRKALKDNDHVIYIPISKHLSSTIETAKMISNEDEFKGKVTVYDSKFIGPWLLQFKDKFKNMIKGGATFDEFIEVLDSQKDRMIGWVYPNNLERLYHSGRLSRARYLSGSLLKITPIIEIKNGSLNDGEVIKTRSKEKAINIIVEKTLNSNNKIKNDGWKSKVIIVILGEKGESYELMKKKFDDNNVKTITLSLPSEILGHVGIGGIGAGAVYDVGDEYTPKK